MITAFVCPSALDAPAEERPPEIHTQKNETKQTNKQQDIYVVVSLVRRLSEGWNVFCFYYCYFQIAFTLIQYLHVNL